MFNENNRLCKHQCGNSAGRKLNSLLNGPRSLAKNAPNPHGALFDRLDRDPEPCRLEDRA